MIERSPTLKDIARELGISASTVSRALQDHPAISQETIEKVKLVATSIDYFPDVIARSLRTRGSKSIGVIVPAIKHDFFSSAIDGMEDLASKNGFVIIVSKSNEDYNREVLITQSMISNRVAAIIASVSQSTQDGDHFKRLISRGIPVVLFDRVLDDLNVNKVVIDDFHSAYKVVRHLVHSGYRRIAHIAGPRYLKIARERLRGYREALLDANIEIVEDYILHGGLEEKDGELGVRTLFKLDQPPEAIFAINDPVAVGAYGEIIAMGLNIPEDVGITGFSNNPITEIIQPPMTTVDQHGYQLGQMAMQLLLEELKHGIGKRSPETKIIDTDLIIRESSMPRFRKINH